MKIWQTEAVLESTTWTCANDLVLRVLKLFTGQAEKEIHGGVPDVEEFIILKLQELIPITVTDVDRPDLDVDDEGRIY